MNKFLFILPLVLTQAAPLRADSPAPAATPEKDDRAAASAPYREALQRGIVSGGYADVSAGWIDAGERESWFFGRGTKPDAQSGFEIGALSEIFTGVVLAQAAVEGKVRLQTSVREMLPAEFSFLDARVGSITLLDLATHHSGLPAVPPNLMPGDVDDPYANYSALDLTALLANYRFAPGPAARVAYSPLDASALAYLLELRYSRSYQSILHDKVLAPLEMSHTGFTDSADLLAGHSLTGPAAYQHFAALAPAAGMHSTLGDLLAFVQANLQPHDSPLRAALLLARQPQADGSAQRAGLGWYVVDTTDDLQTWPIVWRASRTAGFAAFLGFRTDRQQALVLLANSDVDLSALGLAWLEQKAPPAPPEPVQPPTAPNSDPAQYVGLYLVHNGAEILVRQTANGLSAQIKGSPAIPLRLIAEDVLAARGDDMVLSFQRQAGKVTSLVLGRGGVNVLASRLSEHAPRIVRTPIAVNADVLHAYSGDYALGLDTLARIVVRDEHLTLQVSGREPIVLDAFAPDRFVDADGSCELAFSRSDSGTIVGLTINFGGVDLAAIRSRWPVPIFQAEAK